MFKNKVMPIESIRNGRNLEARIKVFEILDVEADYVFVGDSNVNALNWDEFFPTVEIVNRGVIGDKTSDILMRLDSIISVKPKIVLISVGINDIFQYVDEDSIVRNYMSIIDFLDDNDIQMVINSVIQCDIDICGKDKVDSINSLNKSLSQLTSETSAFFLDLGELSNPNGLHSTFTFDGIHLTSDGYIYWIKKISSFFEIQSNLRQNDVKF